MCSWCEHSGVHGRGAGLEETLQDYARYSPTAKASIPVPFETVVNDAVLQELGGLFSSGNGMETDLGIETSGRGSGKRTLSPKRGLWHGPSPENGLLGLRDWQRGLDLFLARETTVHQATVMNNGSRTNRGYRGGPFGHSFLVSHWPVPDVCGKRLIGW